MMINILVGIPALFLLITCIFSVLEHFNRFEKALEFYADKDNGKRARKALHGG